MNAKLESGLRLADRNIRWLDKNELLCRRSPTGIDSMRINQMAAHYMEMLAPPHAHSPERILHIDTVSNSSIHSVHHRFEVHAQMNPGAWAIKSDHMKLTYGELDSQADGLAAQLQQNGLGPADVCAVYMTPSISMVRAILAILKAGGAYLLLDPALEPEHMAIMFSKSDPVIVLMDEDSSDRFMKANAKIMLCGESGVDFPYSWPQEYPTGRLSPAYVIANFLTARGSNFVLVTHKSVIDRLKAIQKFSPISQGDSLMLNVDCSLNTFAWKCLWPLSQGAQLTISSIAEKNIDRVLEFVARERITVMDAEPSLLQLLFENSRFDCLGSLRGLFYVNQRSTSASDTAT